jgi:DNA-binding FrmR family transcriptional regulator
MAAVSATQSREGEPEEERSRLIEGPHAREIRERLGRASGQLRGIQGMYDAGRWCTDVLDQISAVRSALDGVALLLVEDHLSGCLIHEKHTPSDVDELLDVVRRYIRTL